MANVKMVPVYPKSTRAKLYTPATEPMIANEPTDEECAAFVRQAWKLAELFTGSIIWAPETYPIDRFSHAIARHALKQIAAAKGTK